MLRKILRSFLALALLVPLHAEDATVNPVRVCDVLKDLPAFEGKVAAVVGRYSFRSNGRYVSEEACDDAKPSENHSPRMLHIAFDTKLAPKTPDHLEIDAAAVQKLLTSIQKQTSLAKFKFGTPDYDRWAVVYGRVEAEPARPNSSPQLVCVGDSV